MKRRILIPTLIFLTVLTLAVTSVSASSRPSTRSGQGPRPADRNRGGTLVPGNYCISCHLADDPRLTTVTEWKGGIGREVNSPCPAATAIHEELYYTERLLLMIDRAQEEVGALPEKISIPPGRIHPALQPHAGYPGHQPGCLRQRSADCALPDEQGLRSLEPDGGS